MDRIWLGKVLSKMSPDYKHIVTWHSEVSGCDWLICVFSRKGKELDVTFVDHGELTKTEIFFLAKKIVKEYNNMED